MYYSIWWTILSKGSYITMSALIPSGNETPNLAVLMPCSASSGKVYRSMYGGPLKFAFNARLTHKCF